MAESPENRKNQNNHQSSSSSSSSEAPLGFEIEIAGEDVNENGMTSREEQEALNIPRPASGFFTAFY